MRTKKRIDLIGFVGRDPEAKSKPPRDAEGVEAALALADRLVSTNS